MKKSNLISLIPVTDIPIMARTVFICLFIFLAFTNRKKRNCIGCLHGEKFF